MNATPQHARRASDPAGAAEKADMRLANEAWESLLRAQVLIMRQFAAEENWGDLSQNEYDVLYTLAKAPGGLNMADINCQTLLTQGGVSKLVARLEQRGLVFRCVDPSDRRASLITLTDAGREMQRIIGRRHARSVTAIMRRVLSKQQMEQVRTLGAAIESRLRDPEGGSLSLTDLQPET